MTTTTKATHTPGPWVWWEGYDSYERPRKVRDPDFGPCDGIFSVTTGSEVVGGAWRNDSLADAFIPNDANRALILAAPDLLAALEGLLGWAAIRSDWLANGKPEPQDHPISIARAAIARAKGDDHA